MMKNVNIANNATEFLDTVSSAIVKTMNTTEIGQELTSKQIGIFSKYAPTDKAIVDCKIYTLIERYVTIHEFPEIWKEYI